MLQRWLPPFKPPSYLGCPTLLTGWAGVPPLTAQPLTKRRHAPTGRDGVEGEVAACHVGATHVFCPCSTCRTSSMHAFLEPSIPCPGTPWSRVQSHHFQRVPPTASMHILQRSMRTLSKACVLFSPANTFKAERPALTVPLSLDTASHWHWWDRARLWMQAGSAPRRNSCKGTGGNGSGLVLQSN